MPFVAVVASSVAQPVRDGDAPFIVVLGIAQDGGAPQAGCGRRCCAQRWPDPDARRHVVSLGLVDPDARKRWMFEATPDFRAQLRMLDEVARPPRSPGLAGVLLTHAHVGHYTGLVHLGHEAIGARSVPVYAMPRMRAFLSSNGPWDQLVELGNITLEPLEADQPVRLGPSVTVTPFLVPHRDEYSETVGFVIEGPSRAVLFVPDVDKWERWDRSIEDVIRTVDVAYLDGTFFDAGELPHRTMDDILHPLITESLARFETLEPADRAKVRFIHLNHTNPALDEASVARRAVEAAGFRVAVEGERAGL